MLKNRKKFKSISHDGMKLDADLASKVQVSETNEAVARIDEIAEECHPTKGTAYAR